MNTSSNQAPVLVIAGPTASGKTSIAVEVAKAVGAEIVGADSMQVYRGLDIGTAKPTPKELSGVPHHLIDVAEPDEPFDVARYVAEADRAVENIRKRGRRVILVGGTGLYIRVFLHGLHRGPAPATPIRERILKRAEREGWPSLHRELARMDPAAAERFGPNDGVRILRAMEVFQGSGVPISEWQAGHRFADKRYPALLVGIERPREELYGRIDNRVDQMMVAGFLDEVRRLIDSGWGPDLKPMQGLGYRQICMHLAGELGLEEAVDKIKIETRRFAKRQLTWFNKEPNISWLPPDPVKMLERAKILWN